MITVDIQRFATHLAAIYSNVAKPILDVILYNYQLSRNVGAEGLVVLTVVVQLSSSLRKCYFRSTTVAYALTYNPNSAQSARLPLHSETTPQQKLL
jgi:hypothetical protein